MGNAEDCLNSDLFNGKLRKIQLFFLKTGSVLEAYNASGANKEVNNENIIVCKMNRGCCGNVANDLLNSASLWSRGC